MNRSKIQQALYDIIEQRGLTPIVASSLDVSTPISQLPALWFAPLKIVEIEGRNSGLIEYQLNLALLYPSDDKSPDNKVDISAEMEDEMLSILTLLSLVDSVVLIDEIAIELSLNPVTKHKDLALIAQANITTYFGD